MRKWRGQKILSFCPRLNIYSGHGDFWSVRRGACIVPKIVYNENEIMDRGCDIYRLNRFFVLSRRNISLVPIKIKLRLCF